MFKSYSTRGCLIYNMHDMAESVKDTFSIIINCRYPTFNYPNALSKTILEFFRAGINTNNYMKSWKQVSLLNTKVREYHTTAISQMFYDPGQCYQALI